MTPQALPALIARALILWPWRVGAGVGLGFNDGKDVELMLSRAGVDAFVRAHLAKTFPNISTTDVEWGLERYIRERPSLRFWYQDVVEQSGIGIDWREQQPIVALGAAARWHALCDTLDADALLSFDLARRPFLGHLAQLGDEIARWPTIARCSDFDLEILFARGLSDLHIHVGGVRLPPAVWLSLLSRRDAHKEYRALAKAYDDAGVSLRAEAEAARDARAALYHRVSGTPPGGGGRSSGKRWWSWDAANLAPDREMLVEAWRLAAACEVTAHHLDLYLLRKHRFAELSTQPIFEPAVGLRHFNGQYFRRLNTSRRDIDAGLGDARFRTSHRFTMAATGDACAFLLESKDLRRVELRIAPMARAPDYWRFFSRWRKLKTEQIDPWLAGQGRPPVDIRFAVHFKRTRAPSRSKGPPRAHTHVMTGDLDRETAVMRVALSCPHRAPLLEHLSRIDVAGNERDAPATHFGLHLRLLRGDPHAVNVLESIIAATGPHDERRRVMRHWERLHLRGLTRQGPAEPRLGLSVHAGEDFADQLEGLYQISGAIHSCDLRPGDAIGHGLALAPTGDRLANPMTASIEAGMSLESLCWLHEAVPPDARKHHAGEMQVARDMIAKLAADTYDMPHDATPDDVIAAWRMGYDLRDTSLPGRRREIAHLLFRQNFNEAIRLRSEKRVALGRRTELGASVEIARAGLMREIIARRVVIEMNPSSNIRIAGAAAPGASPTAWLFQRVADGLLACVNTDNPGVFSSCIENEYALLMEGARENDVGEGAIRNLLERVRATGMEAVYWR